MLVLVEVVCSRIPRGWLKLSPKADKQEVTSCAVEMNLEIVRGERWFVFKIPRRNVVGAPFRSA